MIPSQQEQKLQSCFQSHACLHNETLPTHKARSSNLISKRRHVSSVDVHLPGM